MIAVLGPGIGNIILVIGLTGWERYARVVRAEVLALREREFVVAARALGVPTLQIIFGHILPNTFSSIIVMATLQTAQAILAEAAFSFLGLGTGRTYPSWGQMISLGRDYINIAWWLSTFPGIAILLTVLAINLIGDRIRDLLDPRVT
jgi:peptide/nickel transport system permease protein